MKRTGRIVSSFILTAALLLGQTLLPAMGQVRAAAPAVRAVFDDESTPTSEGTKANDWQIVDPGLVYVGMASPPKLTLSGSAPSSVEWASDNTKVLAIDNASGQLTVNGLGTATITATAESNESATLSITVPFQVEKAASYVYTGSPQGWEVSAVGGSKGFVVNWGGSTERPTDAGKYPVTVSMTDPVKLENVGIGEFEISKKPVTSFRLVSAVPPVNQGAALELPVDNAKVASDDLPGGSDGIAVSGTFIYPSTTTPGENSGASFKIDAGSDALKGYSKNYSLGNLTISDLKYTVNAVEKTVTKIDVAAKPKKTEYKVGEKLDLSGLEVNIFYDNDEKNPEKVTLDQFQSKGISVSPENGTPLTLNHKTVTVTCKGKSASFDLTVTDSNPVTPKLNLTVSSTSGKPGDKIDVVLTFDRNGADGVNYPDAKLFSISDDRKPSTELPLSNTATDGKYTASYTLPSENTSVKLTAAFKGDANFTAAKADSESIQISAEKTAPALTLTADKTALPGGGNVALTVKLTNADGSPAAVAAGDITLSNNRGWSVSPGGSNGVYSAACELPNRADTITFTAAFKGDDRFSAVNGTCQVSTTYTGVNTGKDMNGAIGKLSSPNEVGQMSQEMKTIVEQQVRAVIDNIAKLSDSQKLAISTDSLTKLDQLLRVLTGADTQSAVVESYYTSGSSSRIRDGATITGGLAAANAGKNERVYLYADQRRNGSSRTFLQVDLTLKKNGNTNVTLQTPVQVSIPLPSSYVKRSGVELRHRKSSGGYEYPSFEITGDRGNYVLTFRATSFSLYTLYLPESGGTGGGGWDNDQVFDEYTITAKAGTGGTISPSGEVRVKRGENKTFTIQAKSGYTVDKVLVDGTKQVSLKNGKYTFEEVDEPYTIEAVFKKTQAGTSSKAATSSTAQTTSKTQTVKPTAPTTSTAKPAPSSSKAASSEPEAVSSEASSEPESSEEESLPESSAPSSAAAEPTEPTGGNSGGMTDTDLTVAVVIIVVVVALSLAAIFFGVYLSRKRDEEEDEEDDGE